MGRLTIIGGKASGIRLNVPRGSKVRPTPARARKGLFDSLEPCAGLVFADLFSGTGALGLEAASRGACSVCLIEKDSRHTAILRGNVEAVCNAGVTGVIRVFRGDGLRPWAYLHKTVPDIFLADPPYKSSVGFFKALMNSGKFAETAAGSLLIWECPPDVSNEIFRENIGSGWEIERERSFGSVSYMFYRNIFSEPRRGRG